MATNDKGSDLDVFEGLGKKSGAGPSTAPPPPPPRGDGGRTLLGLTSPALPPPPAAPAGIAAADSPARSAAPPPGRGALPPIFPAEGPEMPTKPGVDVDWDDEDEATQIFDKADDLPLLRRAPAPAAGNPPPGSMKSTLLGLTPPPTGSFPAPVRPPGPGSLPPPAVGTLPPPPNTMQGLGSTLSRSIPPPPGPFPGSGSRIGIPGPGTTLPPARAGAMPANRPMEATLLRPAQRQFGPWGWIGLIAALAIAGGLVLLLMPHTGRIVVEVTDPKGAAVGRVDIYVDGRKQCDTAPCIIEQQSAGAHEVKVLADGFEPPAPQGVTVEPRRGDSTASFVLGSLPKGTGIKVGGTQPGVKLYVDDKEIGPLPQDYRDMAPGEHVVKIVGSERYQPLERRVTVEKDKVDDLGTVTLKVLKGKVTITLATPGARVFLASGTDRREIQTLPISVDIDTAKNWALQASRAGYSDYAQPISFEDGQAEKTYVVALEARGAAQANSWVPSAPQAANPAFNSNPTQPTQHAAAQPSPQPAPQPVVRATPAPAPAAQIATPAAAGSEGFLNINSIPPSTVFIDGKQLGSTPKVHISVPPGVHQVKFVNAEQQLTKTITVAVNAGETKLAVAKLSN